MKLLLTAAFAAACLHAGSAKAGDRPSHDEAITRAAIEILQKKLPDFRRGLDVGEKPKLNRAAIELLEEQSLPVLPGMTAQQDQRQRIVWF